MFFSLFAKECRQLLKSITFYIYIIILVAFYVTQLGTFSPLTKPEPGQESYGMTYSEDEQTIMEAAMGALAEDIDSGSFSTYPIGFYKNVRPGQEEMARLKEIVEQGTGITWEQVMEERERASEERMNSLEGGTNIVYGNDQKLPVSDTLTYDQFLKLMEEVDDIVGGGSSYRPESVRSLAVEPGTYEDALKGYEEILDQDQVTGAYAREFSDYMGLMMGILPVFLAVTRCMRDRRAKAEGVIWSRRASSISLVLSRYLAAVVMGILPLILLAGSMHMQSIYCAGTLGIQGDTLAFAKYVGGWILPTMLVTLSIGFFVTELTDGPLAILVQGIYWFLSTMMAFGSNGLEHFGMNFIPRWNGFGMSGEFFDRLPELITNRLIYTGAAAALLILTILIYELKRRGVWQIHGKLFIHRKG